VPVYPRHPIALSSQAQTVQAALRGRLRLGVGVSHHESVEARFGYSFDRLARYLREYLRALMPLLHEGHVEFRGETVIADTSGWPAHVPGSTPPPTLVAALGPAMLRVAGELADGTITWLAGPRTLEQHVVPTLTRAAAGRPLRRSWPVCRSVSPMIRGYGARSRDEFTSGRIRPILGLSASCRVGGCAQCGRRRDHRRREADRAADSATRRRRSHRTARQPVGFTTAEEHDRTVEFLGSLSRGAALAT
jgi:alkanesulfonate monooxygenase SsuD/methylene tetrahydromethanopterin reductase-like flavin-dependent oxidoreductase (luciferase family)